jgi:hypothetical protein
MPGADQIRCVWVKDTIPRYSRDLKVCCAAVKAAIDFHCAAKTLDMPADVDKLIWDKAP